MPQSRLVGTRFTSLTALEKIYRVPMNGKVMVSNRKLVPSTVSIRKRGNSLYMRTKLWIQILALKTKNCGLVKKKIKYKQVFKYSNIIFI